jgi:hypothetical protein
LKKPGCFGVGAGVGAVWQTLEAVVAARRIAARVRRVEVDLIFSGVTCRFYCFCCWSGFREAVL